jgi:hypothetical protein
VDVASTNGAVAPDETVDVSSTAARGAGAGAGAVVVVGATVVDVVASVVLVAFAVVVVVVFPDVDDAFGAAWAGSAELTTPPTAPTRASTPAATARRERVRDRWPGEDGGTVLVTTQTVRIDVVDTPWLKTPISPVRRTSPVPSETGGARRSPQ